MSQRSCFSSLEEGLLKKKQTRGMSFGRCSLFIDHTAIYRLHSFSKVLDPDVVKSNCDRFKTQKGKTTDQVKEIIHVDNPPHQYRGCMDGNATEKSRDILITHLAHMQRSCSQTSRTG